MHQVSLQEKELSCPVCMDIFNEPKALPECAHNVCEQCLHGIAARHSGCEFVTCPVCRVESYLPPGGVTRLPTNHFMKTVIRGLPGRKEVQSIKNAVELCEKEMKSSKSHVDDCDRFITALKSAQLNAHRIKKQISEHAEYLLDLIQHEHATLTAEVDQRNEIIGSLLRNLRKERKTTSFTVEESEKILAEAKMLIEQGNTQEIIDKKDESVSKMEEKRAFLSSNRVFTFPEVPENIRFIKASEIRTGRKIFGYLRRDSDMTDHSHDGYTCETEYEVPLPSFVNPSRAFIPLPMETPKGRTQFDTLTPRSRENRALFEIPASDYMSLMPQPRLGYRHPIFKPLPKPPLPLRRSLRPPTSIGQW